MCRRYHDVSCLPFFKPAKVQIKKKATKPFAKDFVALLMLTINSPDISRGDCKNVSEIYFTSMCSWRAYQTENIVPTTAMAAILTIVYIEVKSISLFF